MLGEMHKLVDRKGKLIGVLFTPLGVQAELTRRGCIQLPVSDVPSHVCFEPYGNPCDITVHVIGLSKSFVARGAVELWGMTPGEISNHEGFAFLPSAESLAEARSPAHEVEAPDLYLTAARDVSA